MRKLAAEEKFIGGNACSRGETSALPIAAMTASPWVAGPIKPWRRWLRHERHATRCGQRACKTGRSHDRGISRAYDDPWHAHAVGSTPGEASSRLPSDAAATAYSWAVGSVDTNSLTGTPLRAMHRGQCSTVSQSARGVIVSPHRGQFKWISSEPRDARARGGRLDAEAVT